MATIHEQAECLRLAFLMGLVTPSDVDRWATRIVDQTDKAPFAVLELASSEQWPELKIVELLAQVDGPADFEKGAHLALALLRKRMRYCVTIEAACRMLYTYSQYAQINLSERRQVNAFDDANEMLRYGCGNAESLEQDVIKLIGAYVSLEPEIPILEINDANGR